MHGWFPNMILLYMKENTMKAGRDKVHCEIIAVGTELLMGQIANTNTRDIARSCPLLEWVVYYQTVVGDNEKGWQRFLPGAEQI